MVDVWKGLGNGSVAGALSGERGDGSARSASASVPRVWRGYVDPIVLPMVLPPAAANRQQFRETVSENSLELILFSLTKSL